MSSEALTVGPDAAGMRLDLFLKERQAQASRKAAKRLLDAGRVRVNGRKIVIASWTLQKGDRVTVTETPDMDLDVSQYFLKVVYEDEALLLVEKDAGIPCESSPLSLKPSMVQIINAYLRKSNPPDHKHYLGLIHRLDTETSGLMVYTKLSAANKISAQFKRHQIERRYQAVVAGAVDSEQGVIRSFMEKVDQAGGAKVRVTPRGTGKQAETNYRVLERYADASLVEVIPKTGRTHQIRVHLAHIGHPIWADKLYGSPDEKYARSMKRQALHASVLGFSHPLTGKKLKFTSSLPKDMRKLVDKLRMQ